MNDDLVVKAKLIDELSGPLQGVRDEVKQTREEIEHTSKSSDDTGRSLSRLSQRATKLGKSLKGGLTDSLKSAKKWLSGSGAGGLKAIGKQASEGFNKGFLSGLSGALKTPVIGPILLVALVAAATLAAGPAGAIMASGLVAGFGAGLVGLGVVFAAKSEKVKAVWQQTLTGLGADMQLLSKPFESTLTNIAGYLRRTVDTFNPQLAKVFGPLAQDLDKFANQASQGLERLAPSLQPLQRAFSAVLTQLGPAIPVVIGQIASSLDQLSASVEKNPTALADLTRGIGQLVGIALGFLTILNNLNGGFEDLTGGFSLVDAAIQGVILAIGPLITLFAGLEKGVSLLNALTHSSDANGASMSAAANQVVKNVQAYRQTGDAAQHAAGGTDAAAKALEAAKVKAQAARDQFERFIATTFRLQNQLLTLSGAQISFQSAIDSASASIKANGRTLDINTEKGRANKSALDEVARSANDQTEQLLRSGKGTAVAAASAERSRASFVKLAMQMGVKNKAAAQAMAASLIGIPNVTRTAKLQANKADLDAKLAAAQTALKNPKLTATKRAKLEAEIANLKTGIAEAERLLGNLPSSKTVRINVYRSMLETPGVGGIPAGIKAPTGDTHTSRRGGRGGAALAGHARVNAALGGGYHVSNLLTGGGGHGRGSGDHQSGRAVDVVGRGMLTYAAEVRRQGGYAAIHGQGGERHVHAVMGDTNTSRARSAGAAAQSGGVTVLVQPGAFVIHANSELDIQSAVAAGIDQFIRDAEERS